MNSPHALLINPWIYDFSAYDLWMKPVGLLRVAAKLRGQGYNVTFLDCLDSRVRSGSYGCGKFKKTMVPKPDPIKEIARPYYRYGVSTENFLKAVPRPDEVFISSGMTYWYPGVKETIRLVRRAWGDVPVTLGGIYAILCKEHAMKNSGADYITNGERIENAPAWDLVSSTSVMVVQTSYGCPFNCSYCGIKGLSKGEGFFQRDLFDIVEEIEYYIERFSPKDIAFYDDALLVNSETHIKPILNEIIRCNIKCRFHTPNAVHARFMDKETAQLMKNAGFVTIRLGLETSGTKRRDNKVTNSEFLRAVRYLKEAGFRAGEISVYTMFGSLDDGPEDVLQDIKFVTEIALVPVKLSAYSLVPGSEDYKRWKISEGLDPLWHNKTIFPLLGGRYTLEKIAELRQLASTKNKELLMCQAGKNTYSGSE